jgi:hypothetical protein
MTEEDIPWLRQLAIKRYTQRWDPISSETWFRNVVLKQPVIFHAVRTENAFAISLLSVPPWFPGEYACDLIFICADDGAMYEALHLIRASIEWARSRKCSIWRISSDTDHDLAPLAKRVGANEPTPRYVLRL